MMTSLQSIRLENKFSFTNKIIEDVAVETLNPNGAEKETTLFSSKTIDVTDDLQVIISYFCNKFNECRIYNKNNKKAIGWYNNGGTAYIFELNTDSVEDLDEQLAFTVVLFVRIFTIYPCSTLQIKDVGNWIGLACKVRQWLS